MFRILRHFSLKSQADRLIGRARTRTDNPSLPFPSTTEKEFLRLQQPIEGSVKTAMLFQERHSYKFPFTFVIPDRLLPTSCSCHNNTLEDHLVVPPTTGGHQRWDHDGILLDDPTPDMAEVVYEIAVKVLHSKHQGRGIAEHSSRRVCVVPEFPETPPHFIEKTSEYRLREEKTLSRGLLKGKSGCLVMETQQLGAISSGLYGPATVVSLPVILRFDPASNDDAPPALENVRTKVQATTMFWSGPVVSSGKEQVSYVSQRSYSETVPLTSLRVAGARWQKHSQEWAHEQLAAGERVDAIAPSATYKGGCYYLLKLSIPTQLPANKALVPTFNSCLVSRSYRLDLTLVSSSASSLVLRAPLQICR